MQPPLATQAEAEELMSYLADGLIDVVETDHAPHSSRTKEKAERENPDGIHDKEHTTCFGVPGIEFAAPLMFYQAKRGYISLARVVDVMSTRPAEILGVSVSRQTRVLWNMREYRIGYDDDAKSNSLWTPFLGKLALGVVNAFELRGKKLMSAEDIVDRAPEVITKRGTII